MVATMNTAVLQALHQSLQKVLFCASSLPQKYKTYSDPDQTFEFPDYTFTKQEKKEKHAEIKSGLDEADVLIRKMNLEKDSKQVSSLDANQSTCEELMEPGMVDVHALQSVDDAIDKRKRVLTSDHYVKKNDKRIVGSGIVALILAIILIIS
uniref:t-SNARE coiled-coil homology domain-containing protein n=1 Tax=Brassica campestris TaxID=3711 RepID=M4E4N4_BRACM